jgi:hypothetical protein
VDLLDQEEGAVETICNGYRKEGTCELKSDRTTKIQTTSSRFVFDSDIFNTEIHRMTTKTRKLTLVSQQPVEEAESVAAAALTWHPFELTASASRLPGEEERSGSIRTRAGEE